MCGFVLLCGTMLCVTDGCVTLWCQCVIDVWVSVTDVWLSVANAIMLLLLDTGAIMICLMGQDIVTAWK